MNDQEKTVLQMIHTDVKELRKENTAAHERLWEDQMRQDARLGGLEIWRGRLTGMAKVVVLIVATSTAVLGLVIAFVRLFRH